MKFEKTTTIGELLEVAPEKADILLEAGMHCLGCPASQAETLEEACDVHGIDVEELLEKLNKQRKNFVNDKKSQKNHKNLTNFKKCVDKSKKIL